MTDALATVPAVVAIVPADFEAKVLAEFDKGFGPYLQAKLAEYQQDAEIAAAIKVTDAASMALADECERTLLKEQDGLEAVRLSGPGAFNRLGRELGKRFKPLADLLDTAIQNLKHEKGAFVLAERKKQQESYQAAAAAHEAGDHATAQQLMLAANEAETAAPKGTSVGEQWVVERYAPELMVPSTPTHPGLVPDEQAIAAYLRKLSPLEEPALPGVICKLVPKVATRHAKG
jgi:hypothetical protein